MAEISLGVTSSLGVMPAVTTLTRDSIVAQLDKLSKKKLKWESAELPIRPDSLDYAIHQLLHPLLGILLDHVAEAIVTMGLCGYPTLRLSNGNGRVVMLVVPCYGTVVARRYLVSDASGEVLDRVQEEIVEAVRLSDSNFQKINEAMRWLRG